MPVGVACAIVFEEVIISRRTCRHASASEVSVGLDIH